MGLWSSLGSRRVAGFQKTFAHSCDICVLEADVVTL